MEAPHPATLPATAPGDPEKAALDMPFDDTAGHGGLTEPRSGVRDWTRRTKLRLARTIPFINLICTLSLLHLLSDLQSDLRLTSSVSVGRLLSRHPHRADRQAGNGSDAGVGEGENEWQAYMGVLAVVRMCLWASAGGNLLGCYGVWKPSSRFILGSLLQSHIELLLVLAASIPGLLMILLPSLFINLEPLAPLICSEILSHPEAVRDLFEPLMMLTPYDDLHGCDSWVTSVAAPFGLAGVVVWGILKWKTSGMTHSLYRHVRLHEDLLEADESRLLSRSRVPRIVLSSDNDLDEEELLEKSEGEGERVDEEKASSGKIKVDLVVPTRKQVRAATQSQQPILFAPVPRPRLPSGVLRTIQVDIPR